MIVVWNELKLNNRYISPLDKWDGCCLVRVRIHSGFTVDPNAYHCCRSREHANYSTTLPNLSRATMAEEIKDDRNIYIGVQSTSSLHSVLLPTEFRLFYMLPESMRSFNQVDRIVHFQEKFWTKLQYYCFISHPKMYNLYQADSPQIRWQNQIFFLKKKKINQLKNGYKEFGRTLIKYQEFNGSFVKFVIKWRNFLLHSKLLKRIIAFQVPVKMPLMLAYMRSSGKINKFNLKKHENNSGAFWQLDLRDPESAEQPVYRFPPSYCSNLQTFFDHIQWEILFFLI